MSWFRSFAKANCFQSGTEALGLDDSFVIAYCKKGNLYFTVHLISWLLSFASQIGLGTDADLCRATDRATVTRELWLPNCESVVFLSVFSLSSNVPDRCAWPARLRILTRTLPGQLP